MAKWVSIMDLQHYAEMKENFTQLKTAGVFERNIVFLFGHCNAAEELAELFLAEGYRVEAILDNSMTKQGMRYRDIPVVAPNQILEYENTVVCIVSRAYASMKAQLISMGYAGEVYGLVDYDSFSEYSLSEETQYRMKERIRRGELSLESMKRKYRGMFRVYCPFSALGDVVLAMSYLPWFLETEGIIRYVVFTVGNACAEVAKMFGVENVESLTQKEMDEQVQALIYQRSTDSFIAHHDRPYVISLCKILSVRKISFEELYKAGVFGLSGDFKPYFPVRLAVYDKLQEIPSGKAVILSPYAKSVANLPDKFWNSVIEYYSQKGYQLYTNAAGDEKELSGTLRLEVRLNELQSVVERAGIFIGLRSGLCDVIRGADCRKIALYPDCFYSSTRWKVEEIFHMDGWENVVIRAAESYLIPNMFADF